MFRRKKEIKETNVFTITTESGDTYLPVEGVAKWFEDELGQRWVKFNKAADSVANREVMPIVIPAYIVIEVRYRPKPN